MKYPNFHQATRSRTMMVLPLPVLMRSSSQDYKAKICLRLQRHPRHGCKAQQFLPFKRHDDQGRRVWRVLRFWSRFVLGIAVLWGLFVMQDGQALRVWMRRRVMRRKAQRQEALKGQRLEMRCMFRSRARGWLIIGMFWCFSQIPKLFLPGFHALLDPFPSSSWAHGKNHSLNSKLLAARRPVTIAFDFLRPVHPDTG